MRDGHWLILDELNLAPCEVLEALNRVLDDNRYVWGDTIGAKSLSLVLAQTDLNRTLIWNQTNFRELFIAETQTTIKAHPHFMLFATQNPAGTYYRFLKGFH